MSETFTPELTFGPWQSGIGLESTTGVKRRLIQAVSGIVAKVWSSGLSNAAFVLSNGNTRATRTSGASDLAALAPAVTGPQDVTITVIANVGIANVGFADSGFVNTTFVGGSNSIGYSSSGNLLDQGLAGTFTFGSSPAASWTVSDVLRITTDGLGSFSFYKNSVLQATMSHPAYSGVALSAAAGSNNNATFSIS
jgi:predicted nicotinamide N-methyase